MLLAHSDITSEIGVKIITLVLKKENGNHLPRTVYFGSILTFAVMFQRKRSSIWSGLTVTV